MNLVVGFSFKTIFIHVCLIISSSLRSQLSFIIFCDFFRPIGRFEEKLFYVTDIDSVCVKKQKK
jgi:hypothetical protein